MLELVDEVDSKSIASDGVRVRVPPPAPRRSKLHIACSDFFQKSERAHFAAPPFQTEPASLGFCLGLGADLKTGASKLFALSTSEQSPLCSDVLLFLWNKRTSSARSLAPPFQIEPAALGFDLVLGADLKAVPRKCSRFPRRGLRIVRDDFLF